MRRGASSTRATHLTPPLATARRAVLTARRRRAKGAPGGASSSPSSGGSKLAVSVRIMATRPRQRTANCGERPESPRWHSRAGSERGARGGRTASLPSRPPPLPPIVAPRLFPLPSPPSPFPALLGRRPPPRLAFLARSRARPPPASLLKRAGGSPGAGSRDLDGSIARARARWPQRPPPRVRAHGSIFCPRARFDSIASGRARCCRAPHPSSAASAGGASGGSGNAAAPGIGMPQRVVVQDAMHPGVQGDLAVSMAPSAPGSSDVGHAQVREPTGTAGEEGAGRGAERPAGAQGDERAGKTRPEASGNEGGAGEGGARNARESDDSTVGPREIGISHGKRHACWR